MAPTEVVAPLNWAFYLWQNMPGLLKILALFIFANDFANNFVLIQCAYTPRLLISQDGERA